MNVFWKKYEEICRRKGTTPRKAAYSLHVAPATVTQWKNGAVPRAKTLLEISRYFDVPMEYFLK